MIEVLRLGADLWLIAVLAIVLWFLIKTVDLRLRTDRAGMAVCLPVLLWAGWLAIADGWPLVLEAIDRLVK